MTGHLRRFAAACCLVLGLAAPWAVAQPGFQALPPAEWIQLRYFEPKTPALSSIYQYMQRERMLETFAAIIEEKVKWKPPSRRSSRRSAA